MAATAFGEHFKELRVRTGLTLRRFCEAHGFEPGNISRLERGLVAPPQSPEVVQRYAEALGVREGTEEWRRFLDLAAACAGQIPPDIMSDEALVARLPLVFRTLRGTKLPPEKLQELAEAIREA